MAIRGRQSRVSPLPLKSSPGTNCRNIPGDSRVRGSALCTGVRVVPVSRE